MNIIINAVLAFEKPRGVGRYINNLLPAIAELDKDNQYYVYYGKWMKEYEFLNLNQDNIHFIELDIENTMLARNLYLAVKLPIVCQKHKPDILFLIDTQALIIKPCKVISTIHDLAEFVLPEKYSKMHAFLRRNIVKHQVKISDYILTVSQYSKKDICKRFRISQQKVYVTYNAVASPVKIAEKRAKNYFLFVSETEKAKNLMGLIKAYNLLPKDIKDKFCIYVIGKKGNDYVNIVKEVINTGIKDKVKFLGYVTDEELNNLYAEAYAFIFPSFFEGFGLPVLEAMAKGIPVLCSDTSSIPEVGGDAVLTFNPHNYNEIAKQMERIIITDGLREEMITKGLRRAKLFSLHNAAESTLHVINKVNEEMFI